MEFSIDKKGEGYRCDQVDAYVRELRQEYRKVSEAYEELMRQKDAIAMAIVHAEITAQSIVAAAEAQAEQIRYAAYQPYGPASSVIQPGMVSNGLPPIQPAMMAWN